MFDIFFRILVTLFGCFVLTIGAFVKVINIGFFVGYFVLSLMIDFF